MTNEQITALAREYAEWVLSVPGAEKLPNCLRNEATGTLREDAEEVLTWLLRRFYLVEKEVVRKKYASAKDAPEECDYKGLGATWDEVPYLSRFYDEGYKCGQKEQLESLFPEIAKEGER